MRHKEYFKKIPATYLRVIIIVLFFFVAFFTGNRIGNKILSGKTPPIDDLLTNENNTSPSSLPKIIEAAGLPKAPPPNASDSEKSSFSRIVHEKAETSTAVTINKNCTLTPNLIRVPEGSQLTFYNKDMTLHRVVIGIDATEIKQNEKKIITAQFMNGAGIYGIVCDDTASGFIDVEPKKK